MPIINIVLMDGFEGEKIGEIIANTLKNIKNYLEFFIDFL